jgi:hypothetical protein
MQAFGDGHPLQGLNDPDFALDGDFLPYGFIMMSSLPLFLVCPVCRRHFAFRNVLGMTRLERCPSSLLRFSPRVLAGAADALLAKPDGLDLVALFCDDDMGFGWV